MINLQSEFEKTAIYTVITQMGIMLKVKLSSAAHQPGTGNNKGYVVVP